MYSISAITAFALLAGSASAFPLSNRGLLNKVCLNGQVALGVSTDPSLSALVGTCIDISLCDKIGSLNVAKTICTPKFCKGTEILSLDTGLCIAPLPILNTTAPVLSPKTIIINSVDTIIYDLVNISADLAHDIMVTKSALATLSANVSATLDAEINSILKAADLLTSTLESKAKSSLESALLLAATARNTIVADVKAEAAAYMAATAKLTTELEAKVAATLAAAKGLATEVAAAITAEVKSKANALVLAASALSANVDVQAGLVL